MLSWGVIVKVKLPEAEIVLSPLGVTSKVWESISNEEGMPWIVIGEVSLLFVIVKVLEPEDEGKMLFFSSKYHHCVYPFYLSDEERISVSGNIGLKLKKYKDV